MNRPGYAELSRALRLRARGHEAEATIPLSDKPGALRPSVPYVQPKVTLKRVEQVSFWKLALLVLASLSPAVLLATVWQASRIQIVFLAAMLVMFSLQFSSMYLKHISQRLASVRSGRDGGDPAMRQFRPLWNFYNHFAKNEFASLRPQFEVIDGSTFPEPQRSLLVHEQNMTPTLAKYCNAQVEVKILDMLEENEVVSRNIVLYVGNSHIIELGAIAIYLENMFCADAREDVRKGQIPFGTILANRKIRQRQGKQAFFRIRNDPLLTWVLDLEPKGPDGEYGYLFGRCNTILNHLGDPIAEVVEILPFEVDSL